MYEMTERTDEEDRCSGFCRVSLFNWEADVDIGYAKDSCQHKFVRDLQDTMYIAWLVPFIAFVFQFFAFLFQFCL